MTKQSFTTRIMVEQSPEEVFKAINNVCDWWSQNIEGRTNELNTIFFYHYEDVHLCKMEIVELLPHEKIVWFVKDNYFNFVEDNTEWKGTKIIFEISKIADKTRLTFTHHGLISKHECYNICKDAWTRYIQGSLKSLITTGKGKPNPKEGDLDTKLVEKWRLPKK